MTLELFETKLNDMTNNLDEIHKLIIVYNELKIYFSNDEKEIDFVSYFIQKMNDKLESNPNVKYLLVEKYGHDAIDSLEVRIGAIEFVNFIKKVSNISYNESYKQLLKQKAILLEEKNIFKRKKI